MKWIVPLLFLLTTLSGCATTAPTARQTQNMDFTTPNQAVYYRAITNWQDRLDRGAFQNRNLAILGVLQEELSRNGWTREMVLEVVEQTRKVTRLRMEAKDQWDTPQEFIARNYEGDCEDIAIFMLATFRMLGYPNQVRILAVKTWFVDHAMLKVEMPDGSWEVFETVAPTEPDARLAYTPIVEFDERQIIFAKN